MSDRRRGIGERDSSRGQLLLLFAVLIGLLFIVGAGALNLSVIADQERAQGSETPTPAIEEVYTELTVVGDATLRDANRDPAIESADERRERIEAQLPAAFEVLQTQIGQTDRGVHYTTTIAPDGIRNGTRIIQAAPSDVTSTEGNEDWTPISGAGDVREIVLRSESLNATSESTPLRLTLTLSSGEEIIMEIESTEDELTVNYSTAPDGETREVTLPVSEPFVIDPIAGTIDKSNLPRYATADTITAVEVENGEAMTEATYSIVATDDADVAEDVQTAPSPIGENDAGERDEPLTHPAIYQVEVRLNTIGSASQTERTVVLGDPEVNSQ